MMRIQQDYHSHFDIRNHLDLSFTSGTGIWIHHSLQMQQIKKKPFQPYAGFNAISQI